MYPLTSHLLDQSLVVTSGKGNQGNLVLQCVIVTVIWFFCSSVLGFFVRFSFFVVFTSSTNKYLF